MQVNPFFFVIGIFIFLSQSCEKAFVLLFESSLFLDRSKQSNLLFFRSEQLQKKIQTKEQKREGFQLTDQMIHAVKVLQQWNQFPKNIRVKLIINWSWIPP